MNTNAYCVSVSSVVVRALASISGNVCSNPSHRG